MTNRNQDTITIAEAARRLNVSERTVYRMMKTGKLTRLYQYDTVRLMSVEVEKLNSFRSPNVSDSDSNASEPGLESLHRQITEKDAQIAQLLARQKEMSQLLERLQEQLYELTRFVLSQAQNPPTRGFKWAFWRQKGRIDNDPSGDKA